MKQVVRITDTQMGRKRKRSGGGNTINVEDDAAQAPAAVEEEEEDTTAATSAPNESQIAAMRKQTSIFTAQLLELRQAVRRHQEHTGNNPLTMASEAHRSGVDPREEKDRHHQRRHHELKVSRSLTVGAGDDAVGKKESDNNEDGGLIRKHEVDLPVIVIDSDDDEEEDTDVVDAAEEHDRGYGDGTQERRISTSIPDVPAPGAATAGTTDGERPFPKITKKTNTSPLTPAERAVLRAEFSVRDTLNHEEWRQLAARLGRGEDNHADVVEASDDDEDVGLLVKMHAYFASLKTAVRRVTTIKNQVERSGGRVDGEGAAAGGADVGLVAAPLLGVCAPLASWPPGVTQSL